MPSSSKEKDQHQLSLVRNLGLAWRGCEVSPVGYLAPTCVCSTRSQPHLGEDTGVCVRGWGRLLKIMRSHHGWAQISLEGKINNYCLDHRLFPLISFSFFFFFHLCFQKIHCFFFFPPSKRSSFWSINSSTSQSDGATLKIYYGDISSDSC